MIVFLSYPRLLSKLFNKVPITQTRQSKKKTTSGIIKLPRLKFIQDVLYLRIFCKPIDLSPSKLVGFRLKSGMSVPLSHSLVPTRE